MFETAELGRKLSREEYAAELPASRARLLAAQFALQETKVPVIVVIAGADGAGKGETVNRLLEWLDPRGVETNVFGARTDEERDRPAAWRFWRTLPPRGRIGIFFGSWYTEPILERAYREDRRRRASSRASRAIAFFEKMLAEDGALLVKFWFHLSKDAQKKRLKKFEKDPRDALQGHAPRLEALRPLRPFVEASRARASGDRHGRRAVDDRRGRPTTAGATSPSGAPRRALATRLGGRREAGDRSRRRRARRRRRRARGEGRRAGREAERSPSSTASTSRRPSPRRSTSSELTRLQERLGRLAWAAKEKRRSRASSSSRARTPPARAAPSAASRRRSTPRTLPRHPDRRADRRGARPPLPLALLAPRPARRQRHDLRPLLVRARARRAGRGLRQARRSGRAPTSRSTTSRQQLVEHGIVLSKFWLHIDQEEQLRRFRERETVEWKRTRSPTRTGATARSGPPTRSRSTRWSRAPARTTRRGPSSPRPTRSRRGSRSSRRSARSWPSRSRAERRAQTVTHDSSSRPWVGVLIGMGAHRCRETAEKGRQRVRARLGPRRPPAARPREGPLHAAPAIGIGSAHEERRSPGVPEDRGRLCRGLGRNAGAHGSGDGASPGRSQPRRSHPRALRRDRPQPRPHLRPGRCRPGRRRRARLVPREGGRPRAGVPEALPGGEEGERREGNPRGPEPEARAERQHPERARAARHPRDAARQGLHGRQAGHHLARAARRGAAGAEGDRAHLLDLLRREFREPCRGPRERAGEGRRDRPCDPDDRPRAAPREPEDAARLVLGQRSTTAASSATSPRTRRTTSSPSRARRRPRWSPRRWRTCATPSSRSSRTSATPSGAATAAPDTCASTGSRRTGSPPGATAASRFSAPTATSRSGRTSTSPGARVPAHLFLVDQKETRYVDCSGCRAQSTATTWCLTCSSGPRPPRGRPSCARGGAGPARPGGREEDPAERVAVSSSPPACCSGAVVARAARQAVARDWMSFRMPAAVTAGPAPGPATTSGSLR